MSDWKAHALQSLDEARRDIEAATELTHVIVCTIGATDLANERPMAVYTNQSWRWLRQMFAYAVWRFSMQAEDELEKLKQPQASTRAEEGEPLRWLNEVALKHKGGDCLIWPFSLTHNGYGQIRSGGTTRIASRVLCEAAHGPPPSPEHQAAHSCGVRACYNPAHLRWATRLENMADMDAHGMVARGERNGHALLTESDVRAVRERLATGDTQKAVAEDFSVSRHTINAIANHRSWAWLE